MVNKVKFYFLLFATKVNLLKIRFLKPLFNLLGKKSPSCNCNCNLEKTIRKRIRIFKTIFSSTNLSTNDLGV
jgi:hypothetical protein